MEYEISNNTQWTQVPGPEIERLQSLLKGVYDLSLNSVDYASEPVHESRGQSPPMPLHPFGPPLVMDMVVPGVNWAIGTPDKRQRPVGLWVDEQVGRSREICQGRLSGLGYLGGPGKFPESGTPAHRPIGGSGGPPLDSKMAHRRNTNFRAAPPRTPKLPKDFPPTHRHFVYHLKVEADICGVIISERYV